MINIVPSRPETKCSKYSGVGLLGLQSHNLLTEGWSDKEPGWASMTVSF
jgi:hypothetical protein